MKPGAIKTLGTVGLYLAYRVPSSLTGWVKKVPFWQVQEVQVGADFEYLWKRGVTGEVCDKYVAWLLSLKSLLKVQSEIPYEIAAKQMKNQLTYMTNH